MHLSSPEVREVPPPRRARAGNAYQLGVAELLQAAVSNSAKQYIKLGKLVIVVKPGGKTQLDDATMARIKLAR